MPVGSVLEINRKIVRRRGKGEEVELHAPRRHFRPRRFLGQLRVHQPQRPDRPPVTGVGPNAGFSGAGQYAIRLWVQPEQNVESSQSTRYGHPSTQCKGPHEQSSIPPCTGHSGREPPLPREPTIHLSVLCAGRPRFPSPGASRNVIVREGNRRRKRVRLERLPLPCRACAQEHSIVSRLNGKPANRLILSTKLPGFQLVSNGPQGRFETLMAAAEARAFPRKHGLTAIARLTEPQPLHKHERYPLKLS